LRRRKNRRKKGEERKENRKKKSEKNPEDSEENSRDLFNLPDEIDDINTDIFDKILPKKLKRPITTDHQDEPPKNY